MIQIKYLCYYLDRRGETNTVKLSNIYNSLNQISPSDIAVNCKTKVKFYGCEESHIKPLELLQVKQQNEDHILPVAGDYVRPERKL